MYLCGGNTIIYSDTEYLFLALYLVAMVEIRQEKLYNRNSQSLQIRVFLAPRDKHIFTSTPAATCIDIVLGRYSFWTMT